VFTTSGPAYWRPKAPHLTGYNLPHYIYRDSPFFEKLSFQQRLKWDLKGILIKHFFIRDSDAYVVQTDDVNYRVREWLKTDCVYTVSNTYGSQFMNPSKAENKLPPRSQNEFRLLSLTSWYLHKNLTIIPDIIDLLPKELREHIQFVLTLPPDTFKDKFSSEYHRYISNVGPVKPEECPALYKECDALFLPTLLECFSASYAEAMVMRKPIVTSDLGFARTVCGDAALYADPVNPSDYARKITKLVRSEELQNSLIHKGEKNLKQFSSASERAKKYISLCKKMANAEKN
jgi:glycosyltransferase involved in cell wall biosynthesis